MAKVTYKDAGVDLDIYNQAMERLPRLLSRTYTPRVLRLDGGFAGLFQLDFKNALFARHYKDPVLVSCTDGVGTKLKVAVQANIHNTVGIDLVAMSVNDAICLGAEPLFFLDYVAMPKDQPDLLESILEGIAAGCVESDCALLGGETAILPDMYAPGDYDLAGFCVGVVERNGVIDGKTITAGDMLIGVASSGPHSNGYSLIRKAVFDVGQFKIDDFVSELGCKVSDALLTPTRIYVRAVRQVLGHYRVKNVVHGVAHITGGGILENLERILPKNVQAVVERNSWPVPPVFKWIQRLGEIDQAEMDRVFNMGIGLILVVAPYYADSVRQQLSDCGMESWTIGFTRKGPQNVVWAT